MELRSKAQLLFARDGVLPTCICNDSKEIIQGTFYQKLKDALSHLKQLEPFILWSKAADRKIKELMKEASSKLMQSRAPTHLRDDVL